MLTEFFVDRLRLYGASDAVIEGGVTYTYDDLVRAVADWRRHLERSGVAPGQVVAVENVAGCDGYAAILALQAHGAIVVPFVGVPDAKRALLMEVAEVEHTVSVDRRTGQRRSETTARTATNALYRPLRDSAASGLVLFSSGTSGDSKAVVLDFGRMLRKYREPRPPLRTICFLNADHIGGINTVLHTLSNGGTVVCVGERTAESICSEIATHRVELLPTTPTFLTMLLISQAYRRYDLSSLKLVTYGTEPMPPATLSRLKEAMPQVRFKQTYGSSELGILPTRSESDDSVWIAVGGPGFEYKIIDGILWVRSETAMLGYLNAPVPFDAEGYFNTQDVVQTKGDYLRIVGRNSGAINVAGAKVHPIDVEDVLLRMPIVAEAAIWGRPSHVTGCLVAATVTLTPDAEASRRASGDKALVEQIKAHCRAWLEPHQVPAVVEFGDNLRSDRFKKVRRPA